MLLQLEELYANEDPPEWEGPVVGMGMSHVASVDDHQATRAGYETLLYNMGQPLVIQL